MDKKTKSQCKLDKLEPTSPFTVMRKMRMDRRLSQFDICQAVGKDPSYISKVERKRTVPSKHHAAKFEDLFGLSIDELLQDAE